MDTVKIIKNGDSQVVKLPSLYRMNVEEVYIKRVPGGILLMEKENIWTAFERCLEDFPADIFKRKRVMKVRKRSSLD